MNKVRFGPMIGFQGDTYAMLNQRAIDITQKIAWLNRWELVDVTQEDNLSQLGTFIQNADQLREHPHWDQAALITH